MAWLGQHANMQKKKLQSDFCFLNFVSSKGRAPGHVNVQKQTLFFHFSSIPWIVDHGAAFTLDRNLFLFPPLFFQPLG
jgi:hypothetical protein